MPATDPPNTVISATNSEIKNTKAGTDIATNNVLITESNTITTSYECVNTESATTNSCMTDNSITNTADHTINEEQEPTTDGKNRDTVTRITNVPTNANNEVSI